MTIKVFVVDDSAIVRQAMAHILATQANIELVGSAPNPLLAIDMMRKNRPDVLLLDIEMPGMDGLTFLRQIMASDPIPTVICSTLSTEGSRVALDALAAGAVAIIAKPRLGLRQFMEEDSRPQLLQALKEAAASRPRARTSAPVTTKHLPATPAVHALAINKPVVIGSSTGGTQAIEFILNGLPADAPGLAITQHMPEKFTALFAKRLDEICRVSVREARDGDRLERGLALIAPGGRHMQLEKSGGQYYTKVFDGPLVNRHKPSVDVLFKSTAECAGRDALGIILTGMGDDGARGLRLMHDRGAQTIAQDEESCVVFGMPKEAIKLQAVDEILPLDRVPAAILTFNARP